MTKDDKPPERWFPLRTERLLLREWREDDIDDVQAYASQDAVVRYMDWGPNTLEETREVIGRWLEFQKTWPRDAVNLAIELDGRVIGSIRLGFFPDQDADIGYSINADHWNQGYVTEAARALLAVAFGTLGLHRVWATCDPRNRGSWRVMQKLGMKREGRLRGSKLKRDGWQDQYVYGILAEEWAAATEAALPRSAR